MTANRWVFVLPPDGAARTVAIKASDSLVIKTDSASCKIFDTLIYKNAFTELLKNHDENMVIDLLNQSLIITCLDFSATHLITGALSPVTLFSLNLLRKQRITTIHWFYEDYRRALYWKDIVRGYDHFFAIQKGILPSHCEKIGCKYHFLPTALTLPESIIFHQPDCTFDVAFIGIPSSYRITVLETLARSGFKLAIAGHGWSTYDGSLNSMILNRNWTDDKQTQSILTHAIIGINLSVEKPSILEDVHVSPRVYDILACGCILFTEDVPLIYESLQGCTFRTFNDISDLCEKMHAVLEIIKTDKSQSNENQTAILANHTFKNRIDEIIKIV